MPQAVTTTIVGTLLALASLAYARDEGASAGSLAQARRLIEAKDYRSAMTVLEDLLIEAEATERPAIAGLLKQAYEVLARQAQAAGRDRDAAYYRDNIAILEGTRPATDSAKPTRPSPTPPAGPKPSRPGERSESKAKAPPEPRASRPFVAGPEPRQAEALLLEPAPLPEPAKVASPEPVRRRSSPPISSISTSSGPAGTPSAGSPLPSPTVPPRDAAAAMAQPVAESSTTDPIAAATRPEATKRALARPTPEQADRLFSTKKYSEAGRYYAALARENRLPANRNNHWAYCRMVDVAQRINSRPRSAQEWDEIEAEIQDIQRLAPKLWFGEYLRNIVAEARRGRRKSQAQTDNLVVRGSAPDESPAQSLTQRLPRLFGKSPTKAAAQADTGVPPVSAPSDSVADGAQRPVNFPAAGAAVEPPSPQSGGGTKPETMDPAGATPSRPRVDPELRRAMAANTATNPPWQVHETANFRIFHCNPRLAEQAAEVAEKIRAAQSKRWGSPALDRPWAPRCDVYLYPDGPALAQATGQPESAPGFSTLDTKGSRITTRRTVLRADYPQLLTAVLPHEITHVVLADLFTVQKIPRWADEGIAVLAEPDAEQSLRAADLQKSLESGQILDLAMLMNTDEPDAKDWSVYYAQSVSLTRFLVEQDSPERFIQFVRASSGKGIEPALRDAYHIGSLADLQGRWLAYARQQLSTIEQARRDSGSESSVFRVESADRQNQ